MTPPLILCSTLAAESRQRARPIMNAGAQDGASVGELQLRGAWVTGSYLNEDSDAFTEDGWLRTGDVGMIDHRGYVQLTDRTKDVIKSGGEWISSVDLEDALLQHDAVAEIAVIAIDDPRWQERPLAIVRGKPGYDADNMFENLRSFLVGKVAKFWVPETCGGSVWGLLFISERIIINV